MSRLLKTVETPAHGDKDNEKELPSGMVFVFFNGTGAYPSGS